MGSLTRLQCPFAHRLEVLVVVDPFHKLVPPEGIEVQGATTRTLT
jgi:hypothetical protein